MGEIERSWTTTDSYPRRAAVTGILFAVARGQLLPWLLVGVLVMVLGLGLLLLDPASNGGLLIGLGVLMLIGLGVVLPLAATARIRRELPPGSVLTIHLGADALTIRSPGSESRIGYVALAQIVEFRTMVYLRTRDRRQWIGLPTELADVEAVAVLRTRLNTGADPEASAGAAPSGLVGRTYTVEASWLPKAVLAQLLFVLSRPSAYAPLIAIAIAASLVIGITAESVAAGLLGAVVVLLLTAGTLALSVRRVVRRQMPVGAVVEAEVTATELRVSGPALSARIDLALIDRVRVIAPCVFLHRRSATWTYLPTAVLMDEDLARIAGRPA